MKYGFDSDKFYLEYESCSRPAGNMREESDRRALEIAEAGSKLYITISAGLDSQSVLHSFYTQGIPVDTVFFFMPGYNDVEYENLKLVDKKYGIKTQIVDLDPLKIKDEILADAEAHHLSTNQAIQKKFMSLLPSNWDLIQMVHDPFVYVSPTKKFYYYQGYHDPEISKIRLHSLLNRSGKFIPFGTTSEFIFSILNDDVYKSALFSSEYFDGNKLSKPGTELKTLDRWDYYIKPLIYGKYWKDELIYFPKFGGWENVPYSAGNRWFRKHAVAIPYFDFLDHLSSPPGNIKRYYENVPYEISGT
jgi:hypothetical protein